MGTLTPKRQRFVDEYLIDLNATQAAIRAGYAESGAGTEGNRLLQDAEISALIAQKRAEISARAGMTREEALNRLKELADGTVKQAVPALTLMARMQGWEAPIQTESTVRIVTLETPPLGGKPQ